MTVSQVKAYIGETETTYDADIAIYLPIALAAVRSITRNRWALSASLSLTSGSVYATLSGVAEYIEYGATITGTGVASGASVVTICDYSVGTVAAPVLEMSAPATSTAVSSCVFGIPIQYEPTIAKGVMWLIANKSDNALARGWASRSMGPMSISLSSEQQRLDGASGMPVWFVQSFPRYHGGH